MDDEPSQNAPRPWEAGPLARIDAANLPAGDRRDARMMPVRTQLHSMPLWFRDPVIRRRLCYGLTLGAPLLLLGVLTFWMEMSPLVALLVSALVYAGLFMLFIWQPRIEIERETIAEDVKKSLATSRRLLNRIRDLAPELHPLLNGSDGELRLARIDRLADRALAELEDSQGTSLGTADRLETRLSEFSTILELFQKTSGSGPDSTLSLTPLGQEVVEKILPLMERWLTDLSTSLGAEDALNLDVAMRVMRDTLESEGLSRKE